MKTNKTGWVHDYDIKDRLDVHPSCAVEVMEVKDIIKLIDERVENTEINNNTAKLRFMELKQRIEGK